MSRRLVWLSVFALVLLVAVFLWRDGRGGGSGAIDGPHGSTEPDIHDEGVLAQPSETENERSSAGQAAGRSPIDVRLTGRVRDRLGAPRAGERVWLLGPGQSHPPIFGTAQTLVNTVTDEQGHFSLDLGPGDEWALSLGGIGNCRATSQVVRFEPADEPSVEVILGGDPHLTVLVEGEFDLSPDVRPAVIQVSRKERPEDRRKIPFGAPPPPGSEFGSEDQGAAGEEDPWLPLAALPLVPSEFAVFTRLPVGEELRIALVLGQERLESEVTFVLHADEDLHLLCVRSEALGIDVSFESSTPDGAQVQGFYWK